MAAVDFRRSFRGLERVFPPSRAGIRNDPSYVDGTVQPIVDLFAERGGNLEILLRPVFTQAAMIAGQNFVNMLQPLPGRIWIPVSAAMNHPDAAARQVSLAVGTVATPLDPWGSLGGGVVLQTLTVTPGVNIWAQRFEPPHIITRGSQITWILEGMTGGGNANFEVRVLDCPGEIAALR